MHHRSLRTFLVAAAAAALIATTTACTEDAVPPDDTVATSGAITELTARHRDPDPLIRQDGPLGRWVYQQLAKGWLRWALSVPYQINAIGDETGELCGNGQSGPVWYLAGNFGGTTTRSCDVPFGKLLYFPLVNGFVAVPPEYITPTEDEAYWTQLASDFILGGRANTCRLVLRLDGQEILGSLAERDQKLWTAVLDPFPVLVTDDSIYSFHPEGGLWPLGYNGGHYALFLPLSRGHHTLELGGAKCDETGEYFAVDVTYDLNVQ